MAANVSNETKAEEPYNYDDILEHIGQIGKFQLRICLLLCIPAFTPGMVVMSYTFTGAIPHYSCKMQNECANVSIAPPNCLDANVPARVDKCYRYNNKDPQRMCQPYYTHDIVDADLLEKCDSWIYDTSTFTSTLVTEFNLTCENEWMYTLGSTIYMIGMFFGAIIIGNMADIVGRRLSFVVNNAAMAGAMTASAFAPNLLIFCVLRFICGMTGVAHFLIIFVWAVESVGKKYRTIVGFLYSIVFSLGSATLGLVAYYNRDWRTLQLVISLPMFLPSLLFWQLPESTRWLVTKKRFAEARLLIEKAAKMNGKCVPQHLLVEPDTCALMDCKPSGICTVSQMVDEPATPKKRQVQPENIIGIFRTPVLCKRICILFAAWIAAVMSYYGITYSTANLSGNFFINYELSMTIEIPALFFGIYLMGRVGRRFTVSVSLFIGGLACLATGLVPEEPATYQVVCSLIGKFFTSYILGSVYSYSSELFPTNSRSAAVGLCSTFGRIGGILAPIVANLGRQTGPAVPFMVFATVNILVGFMCLLLPETNNLPLPANIQEAVALRGSRLRCFWRCGKTKSVNITAA